MSYRCSIGRTRTDDKDILTVTLESEVNKPASKHTLKSTTLQLKSDEPWDTLEAQLLVKISALLKPKRLNYEDYQVYFNIPYFIPKPGMILSDKDDYTILLQHAMTLKWPDQTIVSAGLVAWTEKRLQPDWTATECNWTAGCSCMLFRMKNCQRPSTTSFRYSSKIHTFWAYFEEKQPRNAWDIAKMICYSKIRLCALSCSCIFWHVEYFYHHKNYMVSYYTLCSIFYN